jgi:hypothetical protein
MEESKRAELVTIQCSGRMKTCSDGSGQEGQNETDRLHDKLKGTEWKRRQVNVSNGRKAGKTNPHTYSQRDGWLSTDWILKGWVCRKGRGRLRRWIEWIDDREEGWVTNFGNHIFEFKL